MKTYLPALLCALLCALLAISASAEFRTWTRNDGKTAELDLVFVSGEAGAKSGEFKMRNGKSVTLAASTLTADDAKLLDEWKPAATAEAASTTVSVFDDALDGNLVALKGKGLSSLKEFVKPTKYYLFYYTASWCGPCQKFTPSLVDFYKANKPGNNEFEIILVTSDSDEGAMEEYAVEKKMTWPHLKLSKADRFKKEFKHPGTGIPNLVLTDTEGNLLKTSYVDGKYMGPSSVMSHLGGLLKK
ncbi:MAG: thioredoxin-like domain-containing protein [Akkermansiaceae bacterium]